jgi:UDP-N-acetylmuramoyl-L-alanyl-D-glutamate--2,6-diaminopimelate ligase
VQATIQKLSDLGVSVTRLVADSREIRFGDTFVAYPGEQSDGRQFIAQAIELGANAVIWESSRFSWDDVWQIPNVGVENLRHQAGWLADDIYGVPSDELWTIGITGTNGKTSSAHWLACGLNDAARKCAVIGTLGNGFVGELQASPNTTPDAIRVHGLLAEYQRDGADAVVMEVSSHALAQDRVNGVHFDVALFTNLSRDHLDYHGDMDSYAASKRKLFNWDQLKYAVINLDDFFGVEMAEQWNSDSIELVGYGMSDAALQIAERMGIRMVHGSLLKINEQGLSLAVHSSWGGAQIHSDLVGRFNASNLLGVLAVLLLSNISLEDAAQSLSRARAVAGRMQRLGGQGQPMVVIDYAHTPDALKKVLLTLREVNAASAGRLVCVFGCGGDRDRDKRAMMGSTAEKMADCCIVTSDNPRNEDPQHIIDAIVSGMVANKHKIFMDRAAAIQHAIHTAHSEDTVLLAGKGHESYQEIAGIKLPFDDVAVAQQALLNWRQEVRT